MTDFKKNSPEAVGEELGFNESELQDIMSEIENLEREFTDGHVAVSTETISARSDLAVGPSSLKIDPSNLVTNDLQRQIDEELENSLKRLEEMDRKASHEEIALDQSVIAKIDDDQELEEVDQILDEVEVTAVETASVAETVAAKATDSLESAGGSFDTHETSYESAKTDGNVFKMPAPASIPAAVKPMNTDSPVSFQAEGSMSLIMNFKVGGSVAKLSVQGDDGLVLFFEGVEIKLSEESGCVVEMDNGIKFNIPLAVKAAKRNVA